MQKAHELKAQGKSVREIAAQLKTSKSTVQRWLTTKPTTKSWLNPRWSSISSENDSRPVDVYGAIEAPTVATLLSLNSDTVFSCTKICANYVGKSDLKVLVTTHPHQKSPRCLTAPFAAKSQRLQKIAKAAEVRQVMEHPLLDLLEHPCPELSKYDWLYYVDTQLSLVGNSYCHIVREDYQLDSHGQPVVNEGLPVGLWPLLTQYVQQQADKGRVVGYSYSLTDTPIIFPKKDVIHFRMISHENPYAEGYGPVRAVFERILLSKNELAYLNSLFRNQARPDSLLLVKGGSTADQCERLQKEMAMRFRQGGIGGIYAVDGDDFELKPLGWAPKDLLGTPIYQWTKLQIVNAFSLSPALLSDDTSSLSPMMGEARRQSQENAIEPRLRLIEERLNHQLCPEFDERLIVEFESPVEEDKSFDLQKRKDYLTLQVYSINEVRKMEGLPPVSWGDQPYKAQGQPQQPPKEGHAGLPS